MKFYIVDAFADKLFGGNPAGVVIIGKEDIFPSKEIMIKTSAELKYSETAFVKVIDENTFHIRYFTPNSEVDLCGHATIATFSALLDAKFISKSKNYKIVTLSGELNVEVSEDKVLMDMSTPTHLNTICDSNSLNELYNVMGLSYNPILIPRDAKSSETPSTLYPSIISTGLPDIILPVNSAEDLTNISPDFTALTELSRKYNVVGVHAFALNNTPQSKFTKDSKIETIKRTLEPTFFCRNFAPLYDIPEEAATGTANGALTYYLYLNNIIDIHAGHTTKCTFIQGREMNRPSCIFTQLTLDHPYPNYKLATQKKSSNETSQASLRSSHSVTIRVGGNSIILAKGEIFF